MPAAIDAAGLFVAVLGEFEKLDIAVACMFVDGSIAAIFPLRSHTVDRKFDSSQQVRLGLLLEWDAFWDLIRGFVL